MRRKFSIVTWSSSETLVERFSQVLDEALHSPSKMQPCWQTHYSTTGRQNTRTALVSQLRFKSTHSSEYPDQSVSLRWRGTLANWTGARPDVGAIFVTSGVVPCDSAADRENRGLLMEDLTCNGDRAENGSNVETLCSQHDTWCFSIKRRLRAPPRPPTSPQTRPQSPTPSP